MLRKSIIVTFALSVLAGPALAENASREESAGVGLGVIIGGVAGGPAGAIIGAAIGAKIGDDYHQNKTDIKALNASLERSESDVGRLQHDIRQLEGQVVARDTELSRARELARPELLALLKAGIEMDLLFRTDEDVLSDSTELKVRELAQSLTRNTDVLIRLDGYADERGDEQYNQALSARRVEHVRNMLVTAGVPAERITVSAHGESPAAERNADSFALERRVSLTLYVDETPAFASNPR